MTATVGELLLSFALIAATAVLCTSAAAFRFQSERWLRVTKAMVGLTTLCFTGAIVTLAIALLRSDFGLVYVASYTERALPFGYKLAALWAGQEGSLLLWGWLIAAMGVIAVLGFRRLDLRQAAVASAALAMVCGFFASLLLFAANPFNRFVGEPPVDGRGLNPMLQDPGMIIHPPLLFLGYAGFTIPFAALVGVLVAGEHGNRWLSDIRRWTLVAWTFLTAGIVVGAWWAYVELGWGGYWAWDPVENASLLPWLTSTALLHTLVVHQHRGMFKYWTAGLIATTFTLCIFGTYLTRSGVIDSVHAFAPSLVGTFFLVCLGILVVGSIGLILWRRRLLKAEHEMEGFVSREGFFFLGNVLLVVMMATTLIGTIWPIISSSFGGEAVTVKPAFYNRVVAPMAIVLVALMAVGPVLAFGKFAFGRIVRALVVPAIIALIVTAVAAVTFSTNIWALICIGITVLGTASVVVDFMRMVGARMRSTGESLPLAALRLIDRDHRRYGGQTAHLGVMLVVIGVAASSLFSLQETFRLQHGESATVGPAEVTFLGLTNREEVNFQAVEAHIELRHEGKLVDTLHPQIRLYSAWGNEPNTEVAIRSSWKRDVYVSIAGWEDGGRITAIQLRVNPGVLWIWIGGIVMGLGAVLAIAPPLMHRPRPMEVTARTHDSMTSSSAAVVGSTARVEAT